VAYYIWGYSTLNTSDVPDVVEGKILSSRT
jgi:hypothetical protein